MSRVPLTATRLFFCPRENHWPFPTKIIGCSQKKQKSLPAENFRFTKAKLREIGNHSFFKNRAIEAQKFVESQGFKDYLEKQKESR